VRMTDAIALVLAQAPNDPGGQGEDFGKSSPVGLVLLIVLTIAVIFLVRSMTKHLKKLPANFDEDKAAAAAPSRVKRAEAQAAEAEATEAEAAEEASEGEPPDDARGKADSNTT
jgi:Tfp pilus assembly protein PilX